MLIVPSGGPESSGVSLPNPRLKALTPAAPADLAAPGARQPRGSDGAHGRGGRGGADLEQPLVQGEGVRPVGGIFGEAAEDQGFETLAHERPARPRRNGGLGELLGGDLQRVPGERRPSDRRVVEVAPNE